MTGKPCQITCHGKAGGPCWQARQPFSSRALKKQYHTHFGNVDISKQVSSKFQRIVAAAEGGSLGEPPKFPKNSAEVIQQAYKSSKAAWNAGIERQKMDFILPLIGATDIDDWPGGIRQQFKAAQPMVEDLLVQLKQLPGLEGSLDAKIIDDADAVGAWQSDKLGLILFPTAETLGAVRKIAENKQNEMTIIVNPQWTTEGQVISDFGVLPWVRAPALELVRSFQDTYIARQLRINGDNTRWLYSYPHGWQISVVRGPKEMTTIMTTDSKPTYKEVENALRKLPWTMSSKGLLDRIQAEAEFNRKSLESLPPQND